MISYFPHPYKDETIYSLIARYSEHIGINSKYLIHNELLGTSMVSFNTEYLRNIEILSTKINHFSNLYTSEYFFRNHTTSPFSAPFKSKNEQKTENKLFFPHRWNGLSDVPKKEHLYYCNCCLKEQFRMSGEGYWQRLFQTQGVYVCYKHLKVLKVLETNMVKQHLNILKTPSISLLSVPDINMDSVLLTKLAELTQNIDYFYNHNLDEINIEAIFLKYQEYIKVRGIAIPYSQIKEKVKGLLLSRFGDDVLNLINSNPKNNNWIDSLFTSRRINKIHPVRHVLIMITLAGSVKNFVEENPIFTPFGEGPWLCLNPLSDHYLERVVTDIIINIHNGNRDFQADFICRCGYVYRLRNGETDPLKVKYFSNRVMKKGHVWETGFQQLLSTGVSIKEISRKTQLSPPTIRKIIKEGIDPIQNGIDRKKRDNEGLRKQKSVEYKQIWKNLQRENPELSRSELSALNRAAFAWLHQNDKKWINANSPTSRVGLTTKKEEKFIQEDLALLKKLEQIDKEWQIFEQSAGKIIRKSFNALSKNILGGSKLKSQSEKFPLTTSFLSTMEESTVDFQKRKLDRALKDFFPDIIVSKYKLTQKAGIRRSLKIEAERYAEELVKTHNTYLKK